ncbi:MAG: DUF4340 domain-containing protein [Acidobacteria bacterium]|nr:DUF4340 domain-containing protein [Acidobacteriota bacterium]
MKLGGLAAAVAVLAVLGGLVFWSQRAKKAEESKPADASLKLLSVPEDQFREIRVAKTGAETMVVEKSEGGKWQITAPGPLAADQDSVGSLVSTLSSLSSDRLIEDKATNLADYGLASPALEVTLTRKDGKTERLLLGEDTPTGGSTFAKLANDPRVFAVATHVKSSLDKTAQDLRDKRLLTFDPDKLTRVELEAKGDKLEFGKNAQNEWQILKPRPLRADSSQVEDLVRKLRDAKMESAPGDEAKAGPGFAAGARVAIARVTDASGTQQIEVRRDKEKNYYAGSSVVAGAHKISSYVGEGLDKGLDDLRNKKLFDFGWSDPSKVEVRKGASATVYQKSGENWAASGKQMDPASVQALIDKLRDLQSLQFLETAGGAPLFEIAVTSNNDKRVEKVMVSKAGDRYSARRENEPAIYQIDGKAVEELEKAIGDVKPAEPAKK